MLDLPFFTTTLTEYQHALSVLKSYADTNPAVAGGANIDSSYFSGHARFLKAAKALMRRLRDKKKYRGLAKRRLGTSAESLVEGSPGRCVQDYNSLLRTLNSVKL